MCPQATNTHRYDQARDGEDIHKSRSRFGGFQAAGTTSNQRHQDGHLLADKEDKEEEAKEEIEKEQETKATLIRIIFQ